MEGSDGVTCLMVTRARAERRERLKASIAAYAAQSLPDKRLLILTDDAAPDDLAALRDIVGRFGRNDIAIMVGTGERTLGARRNESVAAAHTPYVCVWDDDDHYHPNRLADQLAALKRSGKAACFLEDNFQLVESRRALYWTNWARTPARAHPASGLWHRSARLRYPETGAEAARGEDLAALLDLHSRDAVHVLQGSPHLFVYVTHADNLWATDHHTMLAERLSLSSALLRRREAPIRAGLAPFGFQDLTVTGNNGAAFEIGAERG